PAAALARNRLRAVPAARRFALRRRADFRSLRLTRQTGFAGPASGAFFAEPYALAFVALTAGAFTPDDYPDAKIMPRFPPASFGHATGAIITEVPPCPRRHGCSFLTRSSRWS